MLTNILKKFRYLLIKIFQISSTNLFCTQKFGESEKYEIGEKEEVLCNSTVNFVGNKNYKLGNISSNAYLELRP